MLPARPAPAARAGHLRHEDRPPRRPVAASSGDVASVWSPTGSLGHIQGGQYGGYLWPMGPFFALGHALGLAPWVVQRLWLGTLLALAAWGVVRLLDALLPSARRGAAHVVAGGAVRAQPVRRRVLLAARRSRCSDTRSLPWLLLVVHRGLRDPRRWWWPAAFALLVTSIGGGVNAAVTGWLLVGPLLLARYELLAGGVPWRCGARVRVAGGGRLARGVGLVDRAGARAGRLRDRLPEVHRAGRVDLEHHLAAGEPAADGLLAVVPGRRLRRRAEALLRHSRHDAVRPARCWWRRSRAGARARGVRLDAALALRAVLPAAGAGRPA